MITGRWGEGRWGEEDGSDGEGIKRLGGDVKEGSEDVLSNKLLLLDSGESFGSRSVGSVLDRPSMRLDNLFGVEGAGEGRAVSKM